MEKPFRAVRANLTPPRDSKRLRKAFRFRNNLPGAVHRTAFFGEPFSPSGVPPGMAAQRKAKTRKWSGRVTRESDALDLKKDIFKQPSAKKIAASLKRSAERSHRRKSAPYRSAMSMLTFYINRGGKNLSARRKKTLENAKDELRKLFHKEA
jgi:hypothetical protein